MGFEQDTLIYVEQEDKSQASAAARGFAQKSIQNRAYINTLGARLAMKYLASEDINISNIYNIHSIKKILEEIDNVTKEDVIASYREILNNSQKTAAIAGDVDFDLIDKYLGQDIPEAKEAVSLIPIPQPLEQEYTEIIKEDANQAQILQGWRVPTIGDDEYPVIMLLNIILGASGLSSRLFLELREKKGLAYTVRTAYETHKKSAVFSIYIGTEPSNIQTSIDGFKEEIEKIKKADANVKTMEDFTSPEVLYQELITSVRKYHPVSYTHLTLPTTSRV